jgi:hypothetical protein
MRMIGASGPGKQDLQECRDGTLESGKRAGAVGANLELLREVPSVLASVSPVLVETWRVVDVGSRWYLRVSFRL